jgi:cation diffusion facilitator CzcD-associated flavoprotein CzcO
VARPDVQIGIVGAGFAGIVAALRLQHSGRDDFVIFERAASPGGTWRDNTYPGCACDVPSNLYSISFAPKPDWSRGYGSQAEILEYLRGVIREHGLESRIQYERDIVLFEFSEQTGLWTLTDRAGRATTMRQVIAATGPFSHPKLPQIPGLETFQGVKLHSARWDASVDLRGQRVAVIGTGASAIQIVPEIAPVVSSLTVFQRSAAWISDRMDAPTPAAKHALYRRQPWRQRLERWVLYRLMEFRGKLFTGSKVVQGYFRNLSLKKLEREVRDPQLRAKLTPTYEFGCKRILSSDDYLPTYNRANVTLETAAITEITATGIRTSSGAHHDVDVIVFATGFDIAEITTDVRIIGRGGRELYAQWREGGLEAYKGASVSGYPNLNFILGPNTGLGHSSMIGIMEAQMNYITEYTKLLENSGDGAYLDLKPDVQRQYNARLQRLFNGTVWTSGCQSWYMNSRGRITTLYPRLVDDFRIKTRRVNSSEYEVIRV